MRARAAALCGLTLLSCVTGPAPDLTPPAAPAGPSNQGQTLFTKEPSPLPAIDLRRISVSPKTLEPGDAGPVTLRFAAGDETPVRLEILRESGDLVRVYWVPRVGRTGVDIEWDGRDAEGELVPTGVYLYRLYALDESGRVRGQYGDPALGGGEEVLAQKFTFDPQSGKIEFVLPEAARVRLRFGIQSLPILRTYYSWEPLEAGRHTILWDGLDTSEKIRVVEHPKFRADLLAKSLPANAILVRREAADTRDPCIELCFRIELPDARGTTAKGQPLVGDEASLRILVDDPKERESLLESRFEVMIFLDTYYLYEEEDGAVPFNYRLDTRALNPGPHLLTINLLAYDQRIGVQTLEFVKVGP